VFAFPTHRFYEIPQRRVRTGDVLFECLADNIGQVAFKMAESLTPDLKHRLLSFFNFCVDCQGVCVCVCVLCVFMFVCGYVCV
jgi:hypothetical protein